MTARAWIAAACAALAVALGASAAAADTRITISYSEIVGDQLPLWIALDGGYFKAHGLDVTERYLAAQQGIPALLSGQVQLVAGGGADGLAAVAQGVKLKYIAVYAPVYTFQFWARPDFASPAKLRGQKVAVPSTTGSAYTATVIALQQLGLSPRDVAIVSLGSAQNNAAALIAGSVAATATTPPSTYEFQQQGLTLMVDLAKKRIPNVTTGLAAEVSYIAAHRDTVQEAVDALVEGLRREKSDRAFTEQEIEKHLGVKDKGELDVTYEFYAHEVTPALPMPEVGQLAASQQMLGLKNAKVKSVDLASMIDQSFVKNAAAQLGIKP